MFKKVLKSWIMPASYVLCIYALAYGGWWMWVPFVGLFVLFNVGDILLPRDMTDPVQSDSVLLDIPVYSVLPLIIVFNIALIWMLGSGDVGQIGKAFQDYLGIDLFSGRAATTHWGQWVGGVLSAGLINVLGGTVAGHELTHRTSKPFDMFIGRWMLTFSADTSFAIEHVYGHHVRVATPDDPATARRGESFYTFTARSTVHSYVHSYQLERARLAKVGKSVWNPLHSPFMRGNLMNLVPFAIAYYLAGGAGLAVWLVIAFFAKQVLEIQNYFAHYGLVREPNKPVEPRHSWNSTHWMSTNVLYSLARHSHHHAEADTPYWKLNAMPNAPTLPGGYLLMIPSVLIPAVFNRIMVPALNEWDRKFASPAERELAKAASANCGLKGLELANQVSLA